MVDNDKADSVFVPIWLTVPIPAPNTPIFFHALAVSTSEAFTCHLSVVSLNLNPTLVLLPLSISNPALVEGVPVTPLFNNTILSSTAKVAVFKL